MSEKIIRTIQKKSNEIEIRNEKNITGYKIKYNGKYKTGI